MKKIFFILFCIIFIFSSCLLEDDKLENDHITVTVINNTNKYLKYSLIDINTNCYINNIFDSPIDNEVISPAGNTTVIDGEEEPLYIDELWIKPGSYSAKIIVYIDNTYSTQADKYLNEGIFYITDDYTITIGSDGSIY